MLARMWGKGTFLHCWWECKLVPPLQKAIWRSLKKLKIELPYNPAIPLLCIYLKKCAPIYLKECAPGCDGATCTPMFITTLFTVAKLWKQLRCPMTDAWFKKM
jgi:hypothetical protein